MNCENCGSEITGNEKFCGNCGAPIKKANKPIKTSKPFTPNIVENVQNSDRVLPITFIVAAILQLVILILRFVPFGKFYVDVMGFVAGNSFTFSIAWTMGSIETTIFVVLLIISTVLCILPIIKSLLR